MPTDRSDDPAPDTNRDTLIDSQTFDAVYGEPLSQTLDIDTWQEGGDLAGLYRRLEDEVAAAVVTENELCAAIRREIFPRLRGRPQAPREAGCYRASVADLEHVHRNLLFNGAAQACDGTSVEHDTLPVTITQLGVCLVSYQGDQLSLAQQLYRRDLRQTSGDPLADVIALLDNRSQRGSVGDDERDQLSHLARRGIMTYAERAVLAYKASAPWRIGHGNPMPYELLTGSGNMDLLRSSLQVVRDLMLRHQKVVFVPSAYRDRRLLTLGQALAPLEYAVVQTAEQDMLAIVKAGHYSRADLKRAEDFCHEVGPQIAMGVYRASQAAPPHVFYSHAEHVHVAVALAMADSVLQAHRGFPMLIDLADTLCQTTFGNDIFNDAVQHAYASAGAPFRFLTERQTRK
jgi:hypothetical protein